MIVLQRHYGLGVCQRFVRVMRNGQEPRGRTYCAGCGRWFSFVTGADNEMGRRERWGKWQHASLLGYIGASIRTEPWLAWLAIPEYRFFRSGLFRIYLHFLNVQSIVVWLGEG
jgi:hypothetical protein